MNKMQEDVSAFLNKREWDTITSCHDTLLNIVEEVGELWNYVKYIGHDKNELGSIGVKYRDDIEDQVGDLGWLVYKLGNHFNVDVEKAIQKSHNEYLERFPEEKSKGDHGNIKAGGIDLKYQKKKS